MSAVSSSELDALQRIEDRLAETPNESLGDTLTKLLPKLILLTNRDDLRNHIMKIFNHIVKRIKNLKDVSLPLDKLLEIVRKEHLPFAANLAVPFCDLGFDKERIQVSCRNHIDIAKLVLRSLIEWAPYSAQSNILLWYSLQVIDHIPAAMQQWKLDLVDGREATETEYHQIKNLLGNYLLDISLAQNEIKKADTVGSIQPGLSVTRVQRLTVKTDAWSSSDLGRIKMSIIEKLLMLSSADNKCDTIAAPFMTAIAVILTTDSDWSVTQQAAHKANGCRSNLSLDSDPVPVLDLMFHLLICEADNGSSRWDSQPRSPLKDEAKQALLRWIIKEMPSHLPLVASHAMKIFISTVFRDSTSLRYYTLVVQMADKLYEQLKPEAACSLTPTLMEGLVHVLKNPTGAALYECDLKTAVYSLIERMARRNPKLVATLGLNLTSLLFKMLDNEGPTMLPKLYAALGALRMAFQEHVYETSGSRTSLDDVLYRARGAQEPKNRLAALQWTLSMHGYCDRFAIETLCLLADDPHESISQEVSLAFRTIRGNLSSAVTPAGDETERQPTAGPSESLTNLLWLITGTDFCSDPSRPISAQSVIETAQVGLELQLKSTVNYEVGVATFVEPDQWVRVTSMLAAFPGIDLSRVVEKLIKIASGIKIMQVSWRGTCDDKVSGNASRLLSSTICLIHACVLRSTSADTRDIVRAYSDMLLSWYSTIHDQLGPNEAASATSPLCRIAQLIGLASIDAPIEFLTSLQLKLHAHSDEEVKIVVSCSVLEALQHRLLQRDDQAQNVIHEFIAKQVLVTTRALQNVVDSLSVTAPPSPVIESLQLAALRSLDSIVMRGLLTAQATEPDQKSSSLAIAESLLQAHKELRGRTSVATVRAGVTDVLSKFCIKNGSSAAWSEQDLSIRVWQQFCDSELWDYETIPMRFSTAEALVRMACTITPQDESKWGAIPSAVTGATDSGAGTADQYTNLPTLLKALLTFVESIILTTNGTYAREKGTCAVVLLVLIKHHASLAAIDFSPKLILHLTSLLLALLKESDFFTQDISSICLCHLFLLAQTAQVAQPVADEVVSVLLREKRTAQPAGVAVAGESSNQSSDNSPSRDQHAAHDAADPPENNNRARNATTAPIDPLVAAAARAAAELGIQAPNPAPGPAAPSNSRDTSNGYGVYATACKVAKKTGDPAIVFAVISLIRRDPSFGVGETEALYKRYQAPKVRVKKEKVKALLPTLFLARFDPHSIIREVMKSLWESLIASEYQSLLVGMHAEVLSYLQKHLSSLLWREREAACYALESFLPNKGFLLIKPYLYGLWQAGMNVLDDIRDTTRAASIGFFKALSDVVLRAANPQESAETVDECLDIILPILLEKGLVAPTPEGRGLSLGMLVRVVGVAKGSLHPWLVRLIAVLVESMSALEPRTLQYMHFHTQRLNISDDELDAMRLKLSQESPMQEALDGALEALSSDLITDVTIHLCAQLNRGVGLATRVAACKSIAFLAEKYPSELGSGVYGQKAFAGLAASLVQAPDMALSLRRTLLSALGALGKVVDCMTLNAVLDSLVFQYNDLGRTRETHLGVIIGACIQQIVNRCGERIIDDALWTKTLACAYMGSFDADEEGKRIWTEVWVETLALSGAGTKVAALLRVLPLASKLVQSFLFDLKWSRRTQGLAVFNDLARSLSAAQLAPHVVEVIDALLRIIPGQIWSGQGEVLESLGELLRKCHERLDSHAGRDVVLLRDGEAVIKLDSLLARRRDTTPLTSDKSAREEIMAVAELDNEIHLVNDIAMSIPAPSVQWAVSTRGIVALFLNEARRGDKGYKLSAVHALSILPWKRFTTVAPDVLEYHLPILLASIGVSAYMRPADVQCDTVGSSSLKRCTPVVSTRSNSKPTTYKRPTSSMSLFGVRYGSSATDVVRHANKRSSPPQTTHEDAVHSSIAMDAEQDLFHLRMDVELDSSSIESAETLQNVSDAPVPLEDETAPALLDSEEDPIEPLLSSPDPAFKVKLIEILAEGWTLNSSDGSLLSAMMPLMEWIGQVLRTGDVWAIRYTCVVLLDSMIESRGVEIVAHDDQFTHLVLQCIEMAVVDPKSKVKIAALGVVKKLVNVESPIMMEKVILVLKSTAAANNATGNPLPEISEAIARVHAAISEKKKDSYKV